VIVMGVAGSGKTAVGARVAAALGYGFADADDFHPRGNVEKLAHGVPLDDADRAPWLAALAQWLAVERGAGRCAVLACSALRRRYRDALRAGAPEALFVHLAVPADVLATRLAHRRHFMPESLLGSQLETLEPLAADERGVTLDGSRGLDAVVADVVASVAAARR
jgi:gluconokinase